MQSGLWRSEAISLHYFLYAVEIMKIQNQRKILYCDDKDHIVVQI